MTQMEHHLGRNLEERGGISRVKAAAENYIDSLEKIVVDHPPSCHEPDIPGQGTKQRDQLLKLKPNVDGPMTEIQHKMVTTQIDTCNSCDHDLPPQNAEYTEMDEVPFTAYQDTTIRPGYQETMVINAILPTKGLVFMEPEWEKRPPLLAMPHAISNMTSRYKRADLKKDTLISKRRHMRVGRYLVYNTGEDPIFIKKGETLGYCSLIYQDSMDCYLNEMGHMANEARADQDEWRNLRTQSRKKDSSSLTENSQPLSEDWVKDAFRLSDNETLKDKPELMSQLVKVLASHGPAFEGGPHRMGETGQLGAGRTHWVTA